jgi:hypothetical protein
MNQFKTINVSVKLLRTESCTEFGPENIKHKVYIFIVAP